MILTEQQRQKVWLYQDLIKAGSTKTEAASQVQVSRTTVEGWIKKGENLARPIKAPKVAKAPAAKKVKAVKTPAKKAKVKLSDATASYTPARKRPSRAKAPAVAKHEFLDEPPKVKDGVVAFQAIILPDTIAIVFSGKPQQIDKRHQNYAQIKKILSENLKGGKIRQSKLEEIRNLIDIKVGIAKASGGAVTVEGQTILVGGEKIEGRLANRLLAAVKGGNQKDIDRFVAFHKKIKIASNSGKLTERLFDFIDAKGLGIHEDGDVIAFKVVRSNFKDKHTGTMDNSVGKIVEMPRETVDADDRVTCSRGLHVCSPSYISHFGNNNDIVVACKVNPADFVSIPTDYADSKARTCRYEVLAVVSGCQEFVKKYSVKG